MFPFEDEEDHLEWDEYGAALRPDEFQLKINSRPGEFLYVYIQSWHSCEHLLSDAALCFRHALVTGRYWKILLTKCHHCMQSMRLWHSPCQRTPLGCNLVSTSRVHVGVQN